METRYYITMLAAMLALQFMLFGFSRTLNWIFNLNGKTRRTLTIVLFLGLNALVLSAPLRLYTESFRVSALILTLLLFSTFSSLIVGFLYFIAQKMASFLKMALSNPFFEFYYCRFI